jgi:hypothetical protein
MRRTRDARVLVGLVVGVSVVLAVPAAGALAAEDRVDGSGVSAAGRPTKSIDADTLDGLDSTAFAAAASEPFAATGTGADGELRSPMYVSSRVVVARVTITAPEDGSVLLTGEASFDARETREPELVRAYLSGDGVDKASAVWGPGDVDGLYDQHQTMTAAVPVSAGAHTFDLVLSDEWPNGAYRDSVASGYVNPRVTALYLPGQG